MLRAWHGRHKDDHANYYVFPTLLQHTAENVVDDDVLIEAKLEILSHLTFLTLIFNNYIPEENFVPVKKFLYIKKSFVISMMQLSLVPKEEAELLHLCCSLTLVDDFVRLNLCLFWAKNKGEFPLLRKKAIILLL